jgi:hypothetical protein
MRIQAILLSFFIGLIGCGYVKSGQWDDDPRNWDRAFGQFGLQIPKGWRVVQSRYWRYPHFTYEGGYYFQVQVSQEGRHLLMHPDYVRLKPEEAAMQRGHVMRSLRGLRRRALLAMKSGAPKRALPITAS